jgi:hypothetical protein
MENYPNIPALGFSATELMALTFSRNLLKPLEGTEIQTSLNSALNKVAVALPPQGHEYVRAMEKVFSIGLSTGSDTTFLSTGSDTIFLTIFQMGSFVNRSLTGIVVFRVAVFI